jgi:hypothetical protein
MFISSFLLLLQIAGLHFALTLGREADGTKPVRNRVNGNVRSHYKVAFVRSHEDGCLPSFQDRPITLAQDYGL